MPAETSTPEDHAHWVGALEGHELRHLLGSRTLEVSLASDIGYVEPPCLRDGVVHAVVRDASLGVDVVVSIEEPDDGTLGGTCSRCALTFGPCVHMGVLTVDLAFSSSLRVALLEGEPTRAAAAEAPRVRKGMLLERTFDRAFSTWLVPAREASVVEIAAAPLAENEAHVARGYGDRVGAAPPAALAIFVRRRGERKLLAPREVVALDFPARERRVLAYARDRGAGRKSVFASGNEASLALEAMRVHGGIFAAGFTRRLDFRAAIVRPAIRLGAPDASDGPNAPPDGFDALAAQWVTDDDATAIPFGAATLFAGPFPYVWTRAGAIYRVARDVDLEVASGLTRAPVLYVPPGRLKDAGRRLFGATRGRGVVLPAHESFGLPALETPRIALRLEGEPLLFHGDLVAIYRGREVSLLAPDARSKNEEGRDLECEERARDALRRAGLVGDEARDDGEREADARDDGAPPIVVADERAVAFWQEGLLEVRAARDPAIDVELSARLARVRVGAPLTARVHVTLEGDWLRTRLEFRGDDLPVELGVVRSALAQKKRWVVLDDGTMSRISTSIEALADEAGDVMRGEDEALLPPHQLGRLDRWIEENDGRIDAATIALRRRLRALAVAAEPEVPRGLEGTLRPYQRRGLAWLQFLDSLGAGGILADDMGLGKTITALAYLQWKKERGGAQPSLVVCPTSVATNWVAEAARFTPGLRVLLLHGPARDRARIDEHDLVVTTYAILRRDAEALASRRFRAAILDEAQNIKNADSATTRAAARLDAGMRLALSGTPMENRLRELWSLASFANPGILGTSRHFETRFERPILADRSSALATELRAVLRPFLLRRTKADVLQELPAKTEIHRAVSLTTADKRMYDALALTLRESVAKDFEKRRGTVSLSVFAALTRLRQMACDPRLVDPTVAGAGGAKREAFLDLVRELVAEGRRALVFSQFVALLTLWRRDLDAEKIAYEYLDGSTTKRDEVVRRFQEGSAPLFLISLKAGGVGLNLTAADTVIHCDPWWNPATEDQATDRAHRIGQDKPVTVVRLVARGTIEDKILALKAKKRTLASLVVGDDARALEGLSEEDLRLLLGDADAGGDEATDDDDAAAPTDVLATMDEVTDPEYLALAAQVKRWLAETGCVASDLAALCELPDAFAVRLSRGEPFPCSRAVCERIRRRIRAW